MSTAPIPEQTLAAAAFLESMSPDRCAAWLHAGFRGLSGSVVDQPPFGEAYALLQTFDDITEDLAAAYRVLEAQGRGQAFVDALSAVVRRFKISDPIDQKAMGLALRLGARISAYGLLPLIIKKPFNSGAAPGEQLTRLQELAIDVAVELASGSATAVQDLRDIVSSGVFDADILDSKAPTLLLTLCDVRGDELMDHLFRLEESLFRHYQPAPDEDEDAMVYGRALLVTDLGKHARPHILGGVIDFALANRDWRLAWLGDVLVTASAANILPQPDAEQGRVLLETLTQSSAPAEPPHWVRLPKHREITRAEHRRYYDILSADTVDPVAEEDAYAGLMADFSRKHSKDLGRLVIQDKEGYE